MTSRKEVLTTCGVTQAIKQAACLIGCVTPQVVSTSFRLVTSNQRSPKTGDFVASKFYGKVPRPFFRHHKEKRKKAVWLRETKAGLDHVIATLY